MNPLVLDSSPWSLTWIRHVNERRTLWQGAVEHIRICILQSIKSFFLSRTQVRDCNSGGLNSRWWIPIKHAYINCPCINIFKIKLNPFVSRGDFAYYLGAHNYAFSMRRSRREIPVSLRMRNFYLRISVSSVVFNKCEFENGSSGKHKRSRTDVVQSNICCYQDIEDCQYQDKRYRMDLDGTLRVVFFWRFFYSALYDFLHFRDALTPDDAIKRDDRALSC